MRFLVVLLAIFAVFSCSNRKDEANTAAAEGRAVSEQKKNDYPELTLRLVDGEELSTRALQGDNLFFLFQPDCDHCQQEAAQVEQHLGEFKNYTLYFISSAPMEEIKAFAETYKLADHSNVKFAWTSTDGVLNHYGAIRTPSVYIYSDGVLKGSFNGQTEIENILNAL